MEDESTSENEKEVAPSDNEVGFLWPNIASVEGPLKFSLTIGGPAFFAKVIAG